MNNSNNEENKKKMNHETKQNTQSESFHTFFLAPDAFLSYAEFCINILSNTC